MTTNDKDIRRHAIMKAELAKTRMTGDDFNLDPEDRLICTVIGLCVLEDPSRAPTYAEIARRLDYLVSERTVARRCAAMVERGMLTQTKAGLRAVRHDDIMALADRVYEMYRGIILETEAQINTRSAAE